MAHLDFIGLVHKQTNRDYVSRVTEYPKAKAAEKAKGWGYDYWDGDRNTGYGGMRYDGRWAKVAPAIAQHYQLQPGDKILDVGCGKAYLLYDFTQVLPDAKITGLDISSYAIEHAKPEAKPRLLQGHAKELPFEDNSFDLVVSINTLHNLPCYELDSALREIERVGKSHKFICVESYRNEEEKANLLYWQLTCEAFNTPEEWEWWFEKTGYTGDHDFIFFE